MKKLFVIFAAVMLLLCGCGESAEQNKQNKQNSPFTVIETRIGSRTAGDGCVYEVIYHTDGTQEIGVMDIKSGTIKPLNEETMRETHPFLIPIYSMRTAIFIICWSIHTVRQYISTRQTVNL